MARNLVYIGIVVLAAIAVILGYKIYQQTQVRQDMSPVSQSQDSQPAPKQPESTESLVSLLGHPNLVTITNGNLYTFKGEIDGYTKGQLTLKSEGDLLPTFPITDQTKIISGKLTDLKAGQKVFIAAMYDREKGWQILQVTLVKSYEMTDPTVP